MLKHVLGSGLALLFCGALLAGDEYQVKIARTSKAGDKWVVSGTSTKSQTMNMAGQAQKQYGSMNCEGTVEVLEVGTDGKPTKATLTIAKCEMKNAEDGTMSQVLKEGAKVTEAIVNGQKSITVDGEGNVEETVKDLLGDFLPVEEPGKKHTDDEVFGTKDKKKVGDTWQLSADLIAEDLGGAMKTQIDPKGVKGTCTLKSVGDVDGTPCMTVSAEFTITGLTPPGLPPNAQVSGGELKASLEGALPIDPNDIPRSETTSMKMGFKASMKDEQGNQMDMEITVEQSAHKTRKPVK